MGLRNDIYASVSEALTGDLKDAVTKLDCTRTVTSDYNPMTATATETSVTYSMTGVMYNKEVSYIGSSQESQELKVESGDMDFLVLVDDLTQTPQIDDKCTVATSGVTYRVINYTPDPTGATLVLHLRRHHG